VEERKLQDKADKKKEKQKEKERGKGNLSQSHLAGRKVKVKLKANPKEAAALKLLQHQGAVQEDRPKVLPVGQRHQKANRLPAPMSRAAAQREGVPPVHEIVSLQSIQIQPCSFEQGFFALKQIVNC
jgi:hypothetical protein